MNDSLKKLLDDFIKKIGDEDLNMLKRMPRETVFNYIYFLYKKFYDAYPSGELYETLIEIFAKEKAA